MEIGKGEKTEEREGKLNAENQNNHFMRLLRLSWVTASLGRRTFIVSFPNQFLLSLVLARSFSVTPSFQAFEISSVNLPHTDMVKVRMHHVNFYKWLAVRLLELI